MGPLEFPHLRSERWGTRIFQDAGQIPKELDRVAEALLGVDEKAGVGW